MGNKSRRCTCRSEEKTPGCDQREKKNVATRSVNVASAIIDLVTKIIKLIEAIGPMFGG